MMHSALPTRAWRMGVLCSWSRAGRIVKAPAVYSSDPWRKNVLLHHTIEVWEAVCSGFLRTDALLCLTPVTAAVVADLTHGDESCCNRTAFSVCGTWLATCSRDGTICVWLTSTWEHVFTAAPQQQRC